MKINPDAFRNANPGVVLNNERGDRLVSSGISTRLSVPFHPRRIGNPDPYGVGAIDFATVAESAVAGLELARKYVPAFCEVWSVLPEWALEDPAVHVVAMLTTFTGSKGQEVPVTRGCVVAWADTAVTYEEGAAFLALFGLAVPMLLTFATTVERVVTASKPAGTIAVPTATPHRSRYGTPDIAEIDDAGRIAQRKRERAATLAAMRARAVKRNAAAKRLQADLLTRNGFAFRPAPNRDAR